MKFIRMISKIDIRMEIGILDDALSIVCNYPLVDAPNILIEKVDFRQTDSLNCVEDSDKFDGNGFIGSMSLVFSGEKFDRFGFLGLVLELAVDVVLHHCPKSIHPSARQQPKLTDESGNCPRRIRTS